MISRVNKVGMRKTSHDVCNQDLLSQGDDVFGRLRLGNQPQQSGKFYPVSLTATDRSSVHHSLTSKLPTANVYPISAVNQWFDSTVVGSHGNSMTPFLSMGQSGAVSCQNVVFDSVYKNADLPPHRALTSADSVDHWRSGAPTDVAVPADEWTYPMYAPFEI